MNSLSKFLDGLEAIPWFEHLGDANRPMAGVRRLRSWDDWPGPEDDGVEAAATRAQQLKDELDQEASRRQVDIRQRWDSIQTAVRTQASKAVPYDPYQDSWHGPTQCVWDAAWYAALIACHLQLELPIPIDLGRIWSYFEMGHWPCGYVNPPRNPVDGSAYAAAELLVF